MSSNHNFQTIRVHQENNIGYLQIYRPEAKNTINDLLIQECNQVLKDWETITNIVVLEGLPEIFCFGADFSGMANQAQNGSVNNQHPEVLYGLWLKLATGPFVTIAKVRGLVNAGGVGFVSACDIVLAEKTATFSLSELLFSLMPACVLPFLIRKVGYQKAHYMTLMTQPVTAEAAHTMGLVDAIGENADDLLRKHLLRLSRLSKKGIVRYKKYMNQLNDSAVAHANKAVTANLEVFTDVESIERIIRYVKTGKFPWETD